MDTIMQRKVLHIYKSNGGRKRYAALKIANWFGILQAARDAATGYGRRNEVAINQVGREILSGLLVPAYLDRALTVYQRAYTAMWDAEDGSMHIPLFVGPKFGSYEQEEE